LPRQTKTPPPHLQPVAEPVYPLNISPEAKALVMHERGLTIIAWRQLGAEIDYCKPRGKKPLEGGEEFCRTDPELRDWIDDDNRQGLNGAITLHQGVIEARIFGPDDSLARCFFAACAKLGVPARYAIARHSQATAASVLFKLRDDEARRLDDDYSTFKPRSFAIDDTRRGVMLNYAPPVKKGSSAHKVTTLVPGSLLWHDNASDYDLLVWRDASGQKPAARWQTGPAPIEFFQIVRAAAYAAILNLVPGQIWEEYGARRSFSEWLARVVRDGQAINANVAFSKAARAIISEPGQAEILLALICESKGLEALRDECLEMFRFARKRLDADPARSDVAGWSIIKERFGEQTHKALRSVLNVGADSTLLEDFAERYLFHSGQSQFIDRQAFREGHATFIFNKDGLTLRHAPDLIQTKKKPVEAFPIFIKSKLRQDVTDVEIYPDHPPGSIIRVTREGTTIPDNEYAPEHSRLIFNEWRGLYVKPAKTLDAALKAECEDKLDHMLSLVARTPQRAAWIKAHFGWTLKHPGRKQQVALVCTGDQGTGKSFLCQTFAQAVFGRYADTASVRALNGQFYIASYVGKLWVSHDEFVSNFDNAEILKTLIRGTRVSGELKGRDAASFTIFARLSFTSNEANPGISRGREDRGLFQVTSISAANQGILPGEFHDKMKREVAPFYEAYDEFLQRDDVRATYVKLLIDCAPSKISDVENLTHSAMRDAEVARAHLSDKQIVARTILEGGVIHGGLDIAMPFQDPDFFACVNNLKRELGVRVTADEVMNEYLEAGLIDRPGPGMPYLFKWKIGALQRLYGDYLGVPLHSRWPLEPNDDMPNDWREGDPMEPWKGRMKRDD
jgi:hypothetical protein